MTKGSSPRVWGQGHNGRAVMVVYRIIPTRVGTRRKILDGKSKATDHPHACGDKSAISPLSWFVSGSSPRVWGQVSTPPAQMAEGRIIPTRVGTSNVETYQTLPYEDHPHACGDKLWLFRCLMSMSGSSPRVWGQVYTLAYL